MIKNNMRGLKYINKKEKSYSEAKEIVEAINHINHFLNEMYVHNIINKTEQKLLISLINGCKYTFEQRYLIIEELLQLYLEF